MFVIGLFLACTPNTQTTIEKQTEEGNIVQDLDGDGFISSENGGEDCDDNDASIFPDAVEKCDGVDNNCNEQIDEDVTSVYFVDQDGDGFGDPQNFVEACEIPDGHVQNGTDCDDTNSQTYPSAEEFCDGLDNDCNDVIDNGVGTTFFTDDDGDGYGNPDLPVVSCSATEGLSTVSTDCDDSNADSYPGAEEICDEMDNDCDTQIDEGMTQVFFLDEDSDGYGSDNSLEGCSAPLGYVDQNGDCNDIDSQISPQATEICDFIDNNCDGQIDEGETADGTVWYLDNDSDGYGIESQQQIACAQPQGYSVLFGDCNDNNEDLAPDHDEVCGDQKDNNCDGEIDEDTAIDALIWYEDGDGDTFGNPSVTTMACLQPLGFVDNTNDCDDDNNLISPQAQELCNGLDDDCSGFAEDDPLQPETAIDAATWFLDSDSDGFGDSEQTATVCTQPEQHVFISGDCDDEDPAINPDAQELCDETDNNCNEEIDEDAIDKSIWFLDSDGDEYGSVPTISCFAPESHVAVSGDCDDDNTDIHPNAEELCNGIDDNCDNEIDLSEDLPLFTFYADYDQDGYGDINTPTQACSVPELFSENDEDCDDQNSTRNPQADEYCNNADDDCDDVIDNDPIIAPTWYPDLDEDSWGDSLSPVEACSQPENHLSTAGDCNDDDASINPDAIDLCDEIDDDCNGVADDSPEATGTGPTCLAESCLALSIANPQAPSGSYWLDIEGGNELYCDMEIDEGGWTLISVVRNDDPYQVIVDDNFCSSLDTDEACKGKIALEAKEDIEEILVLDLASSDHIAYTNFTQSGALNYFTLERGLIYDSSCSNYGHTCGDSSLDPTLIISFTSGFTYNASAPLIQWWRYGGWWIGAEPNSGNEGGRVHASSYSSSHDLRNRSDSGGYTSLQSSGHQAIFYR